MLETVKLYDASNIETLQWPASESGVQARGLLSFLVKEGVQKYVGNVETQFYLLAVDDLVLPITVNRREYQNSYVASNYYGVIQLQEALRGSPFWRRLCKPTFWLIGKLFEMVKINQMVMVNNWFFSTNPYPPLAAEQTERVALFLRRQFPLHTLIFRGVNEVRETSLLSALQEVRFHCFPIRKIYVYDPGKSEALSSKVLYHHRRDLRLMETHGYTLVYKKEWREEEIDRMLELYRQVYVERYTSYSPAYTAFFLKKAFESGVMEVMTLEKNGRIDGVMGVRCFHGMMTVPFFGYDTHLPKSVGIYRMMSVLIIKEAERRGLILNDSSGADASKSFRGLKPHTEYVAIYDRHLPLLRRLFWTSASKLINAFGYNRRSLRESGRESSDLPLQAPFQGHDPF